MVTKTYKDFIDIITKFDPESVNQKKQLENIIFEFPYFQLAHAIYLKSLKIQDRFNFDLFLKKTAILSSRRKLIFNWIENTENNLFRILENSTNREIHIPNTQNAPVNEIVQTKVPDEEEQKMFFVDWVLSYTNPEIENENYPLKNKIQTIDTFIEKNPKFSNRGEKEEKDNFLNLASDYKFNKSELMTETLAKIYVKQKKIKKALYAYKILSLKYPEKSGLFADQIKKLQKKQNDKI